jgi:hypothetical protein
MARQEDMSIGALLNRLRESGEGTFNKLSEQLLENPAFLNAFRKAIEAKGQVDRTVSGAMDFINVPSKNDIARILEEVESISAQLARQQRMLTEIQEAVGAGKTPGRRKATRRAPNA